VVIEIGPGLGILTAELARRCRTVIAVELDGRLSGELRRRFEDVHNVSVVHADFLRYRLPEWTAYKVVGNIPFSRTAAIIQRLVGAPTPPTDVYAVVQLEAAERFAGAPFAPESMVSLHLKPWWQIEIVRRLCRSDFEPAPRVESAMLWLARRTRPLVQDSTAGAYRAFIDAGFGRTGTTIERCLRAWFTRRQVRRLGQDLRFEPWSPPSGLSFDQWLGLFRFHMLQTSNA
jgi:23S rRNA (adenine-N6)-dimethyltransferase